MFSFSIKVTYTGPTVVREGQSWTITCNDLKDDEWELIRWTRNGQSLERELSSGQLIVQSNKDNGSSKLSTNQATESHEGDYKCISSDSPDFFHLSIFFGSYETCIIILINYILILQSKESSKRIL